MLGCNWIAVYLQSSGLFLSYCASAFFAYATSSSITSLSENECLEEEESGHMAQCIWNCSTSTSSYLIFVAALQRGT